LTRKLIRVNGVGYTDREIAERLEDSLQLCRTPHENILQIISHGLLEQHRTTYFIDTEYCDLSLERYMYSKKSLDLGEVMLLQDYSKMVGDGNLAPFICGVMQELLSGLIFLHRSGRKHGDLSPRNGNTLSQC
jgi:serine/threonine protein kinase